HREQRAHAPRAEQWHDPYAAGLSDSGERIGIGERSSSWGTGRNRGVTSRDRSGWYDENRPAVSEDWIWQTMFLASHDPTHCARADPGRVASGIARRTRLSRLAGVAGGDKIGPRAGALL